MWLYLLKSSACLFVFLLCYKLFLEREQMHVFKRFYLLGGLLASALIPLIVFTEYVETIPLSMDSLLLEDTNPEPFLMDSVAVENPINYVALVLWGIYGLGVLLFGFKFLKNLGTIWFRIQQNPKKKNEKVTHVLLQKLISPHTFFHYLFFNKEKYEQEQIPKEVFWHEEVHAVQKHSLDVLFMELLQILLWFNPLVYLLKNAIKLNHEFLADQAVLKKGTDLSTYQNTLLEFSSSPNTVQLANAINYSSIKKRFQLMKTNTTRRSALLRVLLLLPVISLLIYSFSEKAIVEKEVIGSNLEVNGLPLETMAGFQKYPNTGASEKMMQEYKDFMNNLDPRRLVIHYPDYKRIVAIYSVMNDTQKASVKKYPEAPIGNLARVKEKRPAETLFNSWKDKSEFALWIDGKVVDNNELNKYSASDFVYYTSSFVYNNARSKRFPQPYQNHLYTEKGFEKTYRQANSNAYKKLLKRYEKALAQFLGSDRSDTSELQILKAQMDLLYQRFSKAEKEKYQIIPSPPLPKTSATQTKGSDPKEVAAYNSWAKKMNATPIGDRIIKYKEVERMRGIYTNMSPQQKKKAETFPLAPPPPAMDTLYTYNRLFQRIQRNPHNKEANFTHLKHIYARMSPIQKQQVKEPKAALLQEKVQEKATPKMVAEYNALAKKYNAQPKNKRVVHFKDLRRLEYIYSRMTDAQKKEAQPFPKSPPPPPPAPPKHIKTPKPPKPPTPVKIIKIKNPKKKEIEEIEEVEEIEVEEIEVEEIEVVEVQAIEVENHENGTLSEVEEIEEEIQEVEEVVEKGGIRLHEYIEEKGGKQGSYRSIPFPKTPVDYILEKEKQGAIFYHKKQRITAKKAIALIKTSKKLYITTTKSLTSPNYTVYLSKTQKLIGTKGASKNRIGTKGANADAPSMKKRVHSALPYSLELAKKNAQFYYQDRKISTEQGIEIIKRNANIVVETYPYVSKQAEVKIYKNAKT